MRLSNLSGEGKGISLIQHRQNVQRSQIAAIIQERRTVRKFLSDPVPQSLLLELMNTANWAPNHGLREPWRFIQYKEEGRHAFAAAVIDSMTAEEKDKYAAQRLTDYLTIPIHLLVVMPQDAKQKRWDEDYAAACCWIQCFQLAAWERGLGVVWKTNNYIYTPAFLEAVGVQADEKLVGVLHIGYPEEIPVPRPRTPAEDKMIVHG